MLFDLVKDEVDEVLLDENRDDLAHNWDLLEDGDAKPDDDRVGHWVGGTFLLICHLF